MKTSLIKIGFVCLLCLLFTGQNRLRAQVWGNPGSNVNVTCSAPGCHFSWSFNSCSSDLSAIGAINMGNLTVHIADNTSCCDAEIEGDGDDCDSHDASCTGTVLIVPHLSAPASVAACSSFNVNVQSGGSNGLNCNSAHGCGSSSVSGWSISGGGATCNSPCSGNAITVHAACNLNPITISATYNCNGTHPISTITVNVVPPNPTITGSASIGCGSNPPYVTSNQLTYSASNPSGLATYWVWTLPANMSFVGSPNGQSITVNVTGPVSGNVSVQAFDSNGGSLASGVVNKAVNICCTPFISDATTLNSGNTGYQVEAGSTINSTNDLQSTGTTTMHAAVEVHLLPGFNAAQGCQAHFYNAACSSGFFRLAAPEQEQPVVNGTKPVASAETMNIPPTVYLKKRTKQSQLPASEKGREFSILPNPASDRIFVQLGEGSEVPEEITVYDPTGHIAFQSSDALQSSTAIDISNMANGVYAVKVQYKTEVKCKLVVKSGF